jgi:hypothetical protein
MPRKHREAASVVGPRVRDIEVELREIATGLITLSRLYALDVLSRSERYSKLAAAEKVARYGDLAAEVISFAKRYLQHKPAHVAWPLTLRPDGNGVLTEGRISRRPLSRLIRTLREELASRAGALRLTVADTLLAAPTERLLRRLMIEFGRRTPGHSPRLDLSAPAQARPEQVLRGPPAVRCDPIFESQYSLLDTPPPLFSNELPKAVPYLWLECIRESLGADLCALNSVEYDGLPLEFYVDMSKQTWDEMRHAVFYLEIALGLIPELLEELPSAHPLTEPLRRFTRGEGKLPIPIEGNLYEAIYNATLAERMLLFQVQTEAAAAGRKKRELKEPLCAAHPRLLAGIEYDIRDEITHARIGKTWLNFLLPDKRSKRAATAGTALIRSMLLLTSFAHGQQTSLSSVIDRCLKSSESPENKIVDRVFLKRHPNRMRRATSRRGVETQ